MQSAAPGANLLQAVFNASAGSCAPSANSRQHTPKVSVYLGVKEIALLHMCRGGADTTVEVQHFGKHTGFCSPF